MTLQEQFEKETGLSEKAIIQNIDNDNDEIMYLCEYYTERIKWLEKKVIEQNKILNSLKELDDYCSFS